MSQKTGVHGWPLVSSKHFPGESTLACPKCHSTDIMMTVRPGGIGYGAGGRWRMGDPGGHDVNVCQACGYSSDYGESSMKRKARTGHGRYSR